MKKFFIASAVIASFFVGRSFAPAPVAEVNAESFDCQSSLSSVERRLHVCEAAMATITEVTARVKPANASRAANESRAVPRATENRRFAQRYRVAAIEVAKARRDGHRGAERAERMFTAINLSRALRDPLARADGAKMLERIRRELAVSAQ